MKKALDDASWELNPIGMKLLFENINLFDLRSPKMEMLQDDTIRETFQSGSKIYTTDGKDCSCSYFAQNMFCRHIIMYRVEKFLPTYDSSAIHPSLLKTDARVEVRQTNPNVDTEPVDDLSPPSPGLEMVLEQQRQKRKAPKQAKKYNIGWDVAKEMVEVLSLQDTGRFKAYLKSAEDFVHLLRSGLPDELQEFLANPEKFMIVSRDTEPLVTGTQPAGDGDHPNSKSYGSSSQPLGTAHPPTNGQPVRSFLPSGFRAIPDRHKSEFSSECAIKTIKATGGCMYAGVSFKILKDEDLYKRLRDPAQQFLIRVWHLMDVESFMTFPIFVTVVHEQRETSRKQLRNTNNS